MGGAACVGGRCGRPGPAAEKRKQVMKVRVGNKIRRALAGALAALLVLAAGQGAAPLSALAAGGNVYTCVVHPCYAHLVTGAIEDSGGEASYHTGQGMVEGAVYTTGILEVTDSGAYYLTIRMSLMSYTSGHSFWVQNVGDSSWSSPAVGVTGSGSDSNGATSDICIQVPSENCVVRVSMYVSPMGRDVIFYLYPSDYTAGNNTDMNATIVTAASGSSSGTSSGTGSASAGLADTDTGEETDGSEAPALSSSIEEAADPATATDGELSDAQGLSLSTASDGSGEEGTDGASGSGVFAVAAAVMVTGLVFMGAAAAIVYFFRRNWRRWGGGYEDDED